MLGLVSDFEGGEIGRTLNIGADNFSMCLSTTRQFILSVLCFKIFCSLAPAMFIASSHFRFTVFPSCLNSLFVLFILMIA